MVILHHSNQSLFCCSNFTCIIFMAPNDNSVAQLVPMQWTVVVLQKLNNTHNTDPCKQQPKCFHPLHARFHVLMAVSIKMSLLGYTAVWSHTNWLTCQRYLLLSSTGQGNGWWWRKQAPLKRQSASVTLHDTIAQKTVIFITYMMTWNSQQASNHQPDWTVTAHTAAVRVCL